jgi:DNA-binding transcriptional regulator YhcF (GntR family)
MIPLKIQLKDDLPVCHQIIQAVREAIFNAQLKDGANFPSVRELSRELHISCATAHKAVSALKDSGHLASNPGIGMVVTVPRLPSRDERLQKLQPHCAGLLNEAGEVQLKFRDVVEALRRTPRSAGHTTSLDQHIEMSPITAKPSSVDWISSNGRPPGSTQIVRAARKAMLTGRFKAGDPFPSVRKLSGELRISTNTVHKAVAALKRSGHLASSRGIGLIVQGSMLSIQAERLEHLQPFCTELLKQADALHLALEDVVEVLRHSQAARRADYWKAHQSEWEAIAMKLLPRWEAHGNYYTHQNEFPQMDRSVAVHIDASHKLKVVEFGPGASHHWNQGGFLFVEDANPEAINLIRKHTKGLAQLSQHWFAYEECGLFF